MKTTLLLMILSQGADIGTSLTAFHLGAHEMNPLVSDYPPIFLIHAVSIDLGEDLLLLKLSQKHPKIARALMALQFGNRKSTRLNSSHITISYAVFCLKKKKKSRRTVV